MVCRASSTLVGSGREGSSTLRLTLAIVPMKAWGIQVPSMSTVCQERFVLLAPELSLCCYRVNSFDSHNGWFIRFYLIPDATARCRFPA